MIDSEYENYRQNVEEILEVVQLLHDAIRYNPLYSNYISNGYVEVGNAIEALKPIHERLKSQFRPVR